MIVKNILVSGSDIFINDLKCDLVKNNINHLIIKYGNYYEIHMDGIIYRLFDNSIVIDNSEIYDLYSNILNKEGNQYKDSHIIIEPNFKKNYSKKKVLKNTNGKYKTSKGYAKKSMFKHQ